ncbi:MAG: PIN domain-containing protein [Bacteroidales bacterium]|nr:PIN domain-containing protein [Bacteroidales bacterium]
MKNTLKNKLRAFLDTNITIDVLSSNDREHREASRCIFQAIHNGDIEGYLTTQSILDAQYILSREKNFSMKKFSQMMLYILSFVNVTQIDGLSIREALKNPTGDFEDDAQFAQADSEEFDIVVTSDRSFLARQSADGPKIMTPEALIEKMS